MSVWYAEDERGLPYCTLHRLGLCPDCAYREREAEELAALEEPDWVIEMSLEKERGVW